MTKNYSNQSEQISKLLGVLCVIVAAFGGCWFMAYRVYTTSPTTETITVTLPPGVMAGDVVLVASPEQVSNTPQTVEVVREKPWRDDFSALLHPFGFMILLLLIVGAGGGVIWLAVWGGNYGRH